MSGLPRELGDFVLEKLIGQGGMGEVYYGHQKSLDRPVAIKLLRDEYARDESFIARFKREAKSAAKLVHPNIIQVYQLGDSNGEYYFAMEYVEGKDLQQILKENKGKLDTKDSVRIIYNVARALEIAGSYGIVHRDIKPSNVLITKDNSIKVMDFGLAKAFQDATNNVTMSGAVMGTANYMSPEQAEGRDVDQRTDIYSLGVMFYQLLTGYLPFSGENPTSLAFQHVHSKPIPPMEKIQGVSKSLNDICVKCLAKKKEDRYQTATELLSDLQLAADSSDTNYGLNSNRSAIGKTILEASSEATIATSKEALLPNNHDIDRTFVPGMSTSTKVEGTSLTQPGPRTISNTVLLNPEKTEVKLQDVSADSGRMSQQGSGKKTNLMIPGLVIGVLVVVIAIWAITKKPEENSRPRSLQESPVISNQNDSKLVHKEDANPNNLEAVSPKVNGTSVDTNAEAKSSLETPNKEQTAVTKKEPLAETTKETPKETKEIKFIPGDVSNKEPVEISLMELKSRLPKGFKIRMGILDDQNQKQNLDEIKTISRLPGSQMIEITHDFYNPIVGKIKIDNDGKFSLESLPAPTINHEKVVQQIDNFFMFGIREELEKMLKYGFSGKDLELLNDRIRILGLETESKKVFEKGGRSNIVKAYNLISAEPTLSPDGIKLKASLKEAGEKEGKIRMVNNLMEEIKETAFTNKSGMTFEIIEPGEFEMGSNNDPQYPKRKIKITKRIAMGCYEVTNKEFRMFFPEHISNSVLDKDMNGESQPVVFVDWLKAKKFCEKLSQKEGKVYRLPTEAEWEYCARAGVYTDYSWGASETDYKKNANIMDKGVPDTMSGGNSTFAIEDGFVVTAPVGSFPPNRFKLFDMDGNVREWVNDYFVDGFSLKDGEVDPKGPASGSKRCVRGASYNAGVKTASLYYRQGKFDDEKIKDIGFRIVLELDDVKE